MNKVRKTLDFVTNILINFDKRLKLLEGGTQERHETMAELRALMEDVRRQTKGKGSVVN